MIPRTIFIAALALSGCAHAFVLDGDAVRATAGCYLILFDPWTVNRDGVEIPPGDRAFRLTPERAGPPWDSGGPEPYEVQQIHGPSFGDHVPPEPLTWNIVRRPGGGIAMTNYNGLYGLHFHVTATDSGLVGPAQIASDHLMQGRDGSLSGSLASATVRAARVPCARYETG